MRVSGLNGELPFAIEKPRFGAPPIDDHLAVVADELGRVGVHAPLRLCDVGQLADLRQQ